MCRLYGFRANEPTKVDCSLVHAQNALLLQSRSDRFGRWTFAHNGTVARFPEIESRLARETDPGFQRRRLGSTDSEQTFLWLLTRMERAGIDIDAELSDARPLARLFAHAIPALVGLGSKLNFLLTNGRVLVAMRFHSGLYWLERDGVRDCEICGIPHVHHEETTPYRAVVVASELITDEDWKEVPDEHVVEVSPELGVEVTPLTFRPASGCAPENQTSLSP